MVSTKTLVFVGSSLFASGCLANIRFPPPVIECSAQTGEKPCMRGQHCNTEIGLCQNSPYKVFVRGPIVYSTDGKCGPENGGLLCDPDAIAYKGTCCSEHGWCGSTPGHCGTGCTSGCTSGTPTITTKAPEVKKPQDPTSEPVIGKPNEAGVSAAAAGDPTKDGTCGRDNGRTTCVSWPQGACCSVYGFCGNSNAHCGEGCQSGPCTGPPVAPGPSPAPITDGGKFDIIGQAGVPAMHAGLLPNGRVVFLDKIEDYTQLKLPNGHFAYSSEYDPATNRAVPLAYKTNAFCSGGTFLANGDFISVGGNGPLDWLDNTVTDGFDAIRYLSRTSTGGGNGEAWKEPGNKLSSKRWYPSVQTLGDGKAVVVSGSLNGLDPTKPENNNPTYEILSQVGISEGRSIRMDILVRNQPYYMYPFLHLLRNGLVFTFTAKQSQLFDFRNNQVVQEMPDLPGDFRTYPNTGGSVLLPMSSSNNWAARIMICGGGAYQDITSPTDPSCGVIAPEDNTPRWEMDSMPEGRGMVEGVLLPDGKVLWLNGANRGAEGFLLADQPTLRALLYDPTKPLGARWEQLAASTIPRLYHSVALLLLDGTVMVAGSNPNEMPVLEARQGNPYPTEFRIERFTPPYLMGSNASRRPTNVVIAVKTLNPNQLFEIRFNCPTSAKDIKIALLHGGFVTHGLHMGQRLLVLNRRDFKPGEADQVVTARTPPNYNVTPPGPYVLYVVVDGIPSVGQFVQVV